MEIPPLSSSMSHNVSGMKNLVATSHIAYCNNITPQLRNTGKYTDQGPCSMSPEGRRMPPEGRGVLHWISVLSISALGCDIDRIEIQCNTPVVLFTMGNVLPYIY